MKKKKSAEIQILDPTVYWERKLGINFETEFIRYKRLCERKLSKKEKQKLDGRFYLTYGEWKQNIITTLTTLNKSELSEYIHYLYGRINHYDVIINLYSSMLFPIVVGLLCPCISMLISEMINIQAETYRIIVWLAIIVLALCPSGYFTKIIIESKDVSTYHSMYSDLANISEEHINELGNCETSSQLPNIFIDIIQQYIRICKTRND